MEKKKDSKELSSAKTGMRTAEIESKALEVLNELRGWSLSDINTLSRKISTKAQEVLIIPWDGI